MITLTAEQAQQIDEALLLIADDMLEYRDGKLYWKKHANTWVSSGRSAGYTLPSGYIRIQLRGKNYFEHRLVYLMHHKKLPKYIDHINGDRSDNRIDNLREATMQQNNRNVGKKRTNSSGYKNVHWDSKWKKWRVTFRANGGMKSFGYYEDLNDAVAKAFYVRNQLHQEFANHG